MSLIVNNISFTYSLGMPMETVALNEVSFSAEQGDILSIVGHTGCGKTTLALHLNGLIVPQSGEVFVDNIKVSNSPSDLRKIRERVGLVFQYPEQQIFAETVEEEISFGPCNWGITGKVLEMRVKSAMEAMGLDNSFLKCNPFTLSGGEKRRVAIASVLASDPAYIVLDEPTAGLDANGVIELIAILNDRRNKGVGVIHITHDLELALQISSKILVLSGGSVIAYGNPEETAELLCRNHIEGLALPDVLMLSSELFKSGEISGITWDPHKLAKMIAESY